MTNAFMSAVVAGMLVTKFSVNKCILSEMNIKFIDCGIIIKPNMKKQAVRKRSWANWLCRLDCSGSGQMPTIPKLNRFHPKANFKSIEIKLEL